MDFRDLGVDGCVGSFVVEPVDVVQVLEFDVVDVAPGSFRADQFGRVEPDLGPGQGIVVGVADRSDRRVDAASTGREVNANEVY